MKEIVIRMTDYQYDKTIQGFYIPQEIADIIKNGTPLNDIKAKILLKFAEQGTLVNANIFERCVKEVFKEYTDA